MINEYYDSGINGNLLILESDNNKDVGYIPIMLEENHIPAYLDCNVIYTNGRKRYVYDITSKLTLESLYAHEEISYGALCNLINGIVKGLEAAEEYLLPVEHLMMDEKHIYVEPETGRIYWCYYPDSYTTLKDGMNDLAEYILRRADHKDEAATTLAYELYKQIVNEDYTLRKLLAKSDTVIHTVSETNDAEDYMVNAEEEFRFPEDEEAPVMPMPGRIISGVCLLVFLLLAGLVTAAVLYKDSSLADLLRMKEMQVLMGLTGAMTLLLPLLVFVKHLRKVHEYRKRMEDAEAEYEDDICRHTSFTEHIGDTGRLGETGSIKDNRNAVSTGNTIKLTSENITDREEDDEYTENRGNAMLHRLVRFTENGLQELTVGKLPYVIGKKTGLCDGIIRSDAVSRVHAKLVCEGGAYYVIDMNSTNGTFVNGNRLKGNDRIRLNINDEIRFGRELFYFR